MRKLVENVINRTKFEQLMVFLIMLVLTIALFVFGTNKEVLNLILGAMIGAFTNNMIKSNEDKDVTKK